MQIGIFAKTFARPTLEGVFDAVKSQGIFCVQFNMACAGLESLPDRIESSLATMIREAASKRQISIAAVSGTFNMTHPDVRQRRDGLRRLHVLAESCAVLGTSIITLCTGTRDPENMWRRHPDNDLPDAWRDLIETMHEALTIADECDVTLAFEPEVSNVIDSAAKGRALLDEIKSNRLKVVMDPANLFHTGELPRMREILDEAFALLGHSVAIAHAKDLSQDGDAGHEAAGQGVLDYDYYVKCLRRVGFDGPIILHGLTEAQVPGCVAFLREKLNMPGV